MKRKFLSLRYELLLDFINKNNLVAYNSDNYTWVYNKADDNYVVKFGDKYESCDATNSCAVITKNDFDTFNENSRFNYNKLFASVTSYKNDVMDVDVIEYIYPNTLTIIVNNSGMPDKVKGMVEVTRNILYSNLNISRKGGLTTGCILDGGDLAGKTTVLNYLTQAGYVCADRDVKNICPYMFEHIDADVRFAKIYEFINLNRRPIVFMYNTNEKVLAERLEMRRAAGEVDSKFDQSALMYNIMYKELAERLNERGFENFLGIDCSDLESTDVSVIVAKFIYDYKNKY